MGRANEKSENSYQPTFVFGHLASHYLRKVLI